MGVSDAENLARLRDAVRFSLDAAAAHDLSFYHRNGEGGVARTRANVRAGWEFLATAADLGHAGAIRELATAAGERYVRARAGGAKTLEAFLSELEREDARRGRPWVGDGDDGDDARARRRAPAASVSASRPLSGRARCSHEVRALVDAASRPRGPDAAAAWTIQRAWRRRAAATAARAFAAVGLSRGAATAATYFDAFAATLRDARAIEAAGAFFRAIDRLNLNLNLNLNSKTTATDDADD